jgi:hypothetical protein
VTVRVPATTRVHVGRKYLIFLEAGTTIALHNRNVSMIPVEAMISLHHRNHTGLSHPKAMNAKVGKKT